MVEQPGDNSSMRTPTTEQGATARARLAAIQDRAEELLDPVWAPMAAPLTARHRGEGRRGYDLKLADWTIRLEISTQASYAPVVTLRALLRADNPLGRARDVALNLIQGGWSPIFTRDLSSPDELVDALYGVRSQVRTVPEINRHLNRLFASK